MIAQNQLPLANGSFEATQNGNFDYWINIANDGAEATYSIETDDLIEGSSKALKSEIHTLGPNGWHVSSKSDFPFQVIAGQKYTVTFYAKVQGADSRQIKVVFQSEVSGSYQGHNVWVTNEWQRYSHTFTVEHSSDNNQLRFWYMQQDVTYFLDEVSVSPGDRITFNQNDEKQTVDGFGAGIKRRTEDLYSLNDSFREQVEQLCFQELEVNMIRFFVYHDLEPENDNDDPFLLDESQLDWTRYDSDPSNWRTRYVGEALQNAFSLSTNGFDHIIGNCNSAPPWLKTNGQHNNGGTLIEGGESEFSEFLVAFINGMQSRYGVQVTAISPTNEPDYEVSYESMNTTPSELSSILVNLNSRLSNSGIDHIQIVSPECFRVESQNSSTSATNYINSMFSDPAVENAVDIIGTHTYADPNHNADWTALKVASNGKPIWVTESASLSSLDISMSDAANYVKWILRGFNLGGVSGYMMHLFYEEADSNGYSSLVAWTLAGDIILPKRYYIFKHFSNLVKKDYKLISSESTIDQNFYTGAFVSDDKSKIVLKVFNEGASRDVSIDIPINAVSFDAYVTSDDSSHEFSLISSQNINIGDRYFTANLPAMSLTSYVFQIDETLSENNNNFVPSESSDINIFPNPATSSLNINFTMNSNFNLKVYDLNGRKLSDFNISDVEYYDYNILNLENGIYIIKIFDTVNNKFFEYKFIKE